MSEEEITRRDVLSCVCVCVSDSCSNWSCSFGRDLCITSTLNKSHVELFLTETCSASDTKSTGVAPRSETVYPVPSYDVSSHSRSCVYLVPKLSSWEGVVRAFKSHPSSPVHISVLC